MWTAIVHGEEAISQVKDGDLAIPDFHGAAFTQWYVVSKGYAYPSF